MRQTDSQTNVRCQTKTLPNTSTLWGGIITAQNVPQADQPRAFDDDDLFRFMAGNDFPQEQDLLLLNLIYI